jgi:predicted acyl esterase
VLAYLEDIAPDGQSRYISEGGLRFMHRKVSANEALPQNVLPHSFAESDAQAFVAGVDTEVLFKMWPTSVRIEAGHRVRIAIAGADQTTFSRLPSTGDVELTISRNIKHASHVILLISQRCGVRRNGGLTK